MSPIEGPDFICIGMPRAGTGWLFDQLGEHPDFWMPPIKEIRYLDREVPNYPGANSRLHRTTRRAGEKGGRRPLDPRDRGFLETAIAIGGQPMDIKQYAAMFRFKGDKLTGDITPSYSTMSASVIEQIAAQLPQAKILLLVRDPVTRTWSYIRRRVHVGRFDKSLLDDPERFRTFMLGSRNVAERSQPTKIIDRWARAAPKMTFRYFFFDDLVKRSDWMRREILVYLGADPEKQSGELSPGENRKESASKLQITPAIQAVIAEHLRDELHACAKQLGGYAKDWVEKYGV